jgi:putative oxidoreductase
VLSSLAKEEAPMNRRLVKAIPVGNRSEPDNAAAPFARTSPRTAFLTQAENVWTVVDRHAALAARMSLALVFIWFGVLKLAGDSPVVQLVSATLPFGNPHDVVRALGLVEVLLGLGLVIGRALRVVVACLAAHLAGTFLTFVMAPGLTMRHDNPLLLTADGEFVVKNLVLISTALLVASVTRRSTRSLPHRRYQAAGTANSLR